MCLLKRGREDFRRLTKWLLAEEVWPMEFRCLVAAGPVLSALLLQLLSSPSEPQFLSILKKKSLNPERGPSLKGHLLYESLYVAF